MSANLDQKPATIGQKVKAFLSSETELVQKIENHEKTINELTEKLNASISERDAALQSLEQVKADYVTAGVNLEDFKKQVEALQAEINQLKANAKTVEDTVKERIAELGFPDSKLPKTTETTSGDNVLEKFQSLKDPKEVTNFYRDNKQAILKIRK